MRAFLEHLESGVTSVDVEAIAARLAPGEIDALRAAGFLQPTGSARWEELSVPDVIRTLRALWGAGSGGHHTRATLSHAPMTLGWFEIDDEPCALVLVRGDAPSIEQAARRRERSLVLVPTDRALSSEMRRRHGSRARVAFAVLFECLGVRDGRICRVDLPVPMASPLPVRATASASAQAKGPRSSASQQPIFPGVTAWEQITMLDLDHCTLLVRFRQRERHVTARDLGLAYGSSNKPLRPFDMLHAFCANEGCFKSWRFGDARATKQTLSRLRKALCARFGLEDDPFHAYRRGVGWRARFQVGDARAEREDALSAGARGVLERAGKVGKR
jgi:hypothetical protein